MQLVNFLNDFGQFVSNISFTLPAKNKDTCKIDEKSNAFQVPRGVGERPTCPSVKGVWHSWPPSRNVTPIKLLVRVLKNFQFFTKRNVVCLVVVAGACAHDTQEAHSNTLVNGKSGKILFLPTLHYTRHVR